MDPIPVASVAYASPPTAADVPRAGIRTALSAAWLLTMLAVGSSAFDRFELAQAQASYVGRYMFQFGSLDAMDRVLRWAVAPTVSAGSFGMFAAAALWHWPRDRLAWAATIPVAAAIWAYFDPLVATGRSAFATTNSPLMATTIVTAIQCGGVYAGTRCGRAVARWIAGHLMPPTWSAPLIELWSTQV